MEGHQLSLGQQLGRNCEEGQLLHVDVAGIFAACHLHFHLDGVGRAFGLPRRAVRPQWGRPRSDADHRHGDRRANVEHAADQEKRAADLLRKQQEPWLRQWHLQLEHLAILDPVHGHGMRVADVVVERQRRAFVAADGHRAFAGCERTHALVIGKFVVSDIEPTAFMWSLHPQRRNDGIHRHVPHVEAIAALALLALPLVPRALDAAVHAGQLPSLAFQKSIEQHINQETCTLLNQPNGRGVFEPHTLESTLR